MQIKKVKTLSDGKTPRCQGEIDDTFGPGARQCQYTAKVNRDGTWYCKIHDPIALEERWQQRQQARDAERLLSDQMRVQAENEQARRVVSDFLLAQLPWLTDTLATLAPMMNREERAVQFLELLRERARQWRRQLPEGDK